VQKGNGVKIGMNLLLWTGHVQEEHISVLEALKAKGFDGVEVPIFDTSDPRHYRWLSRVLDDIGLQRTAVSVIPDQAKSPISPVPAARQAAADHLRTVGDCAAAMGADLVAGPWFQPLGVFSGEPPSEVELDRCAAVFQKVLPHFTAAGIGTGLEPLNRFEAYLLNTCEQSIAFADRVDQGGLGILYDTFHANIEERDPLSALRKLHAAGRLAHVHISENDRGTPGKGHLPLRETIGCLKAIGYQGWLTIEAFGRSLPELAAATRVWRDFFSSPEEVYSDGYDLIRQSWEEAR
jgi:D-psicose/D-tagatose/L-ribulose 3-epimerase